MCHQFLAVCGLGSKDGSRNRVSFCIITDLPCRHVCHPGTFEPCTFNSRLENQKHELWGEQVTVISSDMRHWDAPVKADIIVSELLGSFGDNELSPECLDGAQKFLKGAVDLGFATVDAWLINAIPN